MFEVPEISAQTQQFVHDATVTIGVHSPELEIRYAILNEPSESNLLVPNLRYTSPFEIDETCIVVAQSFYQGKPVSKSSSKKFEKVTPKQAVNITNVIKGTLDMKVFEGEWDELPNFNLFHPSSRKSVDKITSKPEAESQGRQFTGYVHANQSNMYIFSLTSDDGSRLYIDDVLIIDNDGLHGPIQKEGAAALAKGWHPIRVEWFNKTGGAALQVQMGELGHPLQEISASDIATR